jgi:hypothetical protein
LKEILNNVTKVVTSLREQTTQITEAVDGKLWDSGHVTGTRLQEIFTTFQDQLMDAVNTRLDSIRAELNCVAGGGGGGDEEEDTLNNFWVGGEEREGTQRQPGSTTFAYDGHFFDVPQAFCFQKVTLCEGLHFWLRGQSVSIDGAKVVKPFRKLTLPGLPSPSLKNKYKVQWKPILSYLEENGAYEVLRNTQQMTDGEIERIYNQCVNFLKDSVSYCF